MSSGGSLVLIVVCLILEGLFSGGEIALVSADINKIRHQANKGSRSAGFVLRLLEKPEWFLATTLTGTNLCVVTSTAVATALFITLFGAAKGEMISVVVMIPMLLVIGEIIPKSLFQQRAELVATRISWFIWATSWMLFPIVWLISRISRGTVRISTGEKDIITSPYITKNGLKFILGSRGVESDIKSAEKEMVRHIFDFSEVTVGRIMVPLSTMTALPVTATLEEASRLAVEKKYLRIPVYQGQIFNIIGILHYFDLLDLMRRTVSSSSIAPDEDTVAACLRPGVLYVPETKPARDLLIELRSRGERMAVVVDEYGGAVGIVTIEDILEEIVGEIEDEHDISKSPYRIIGPGRYLFNARISLERVRRLIPLEIPEGDYETLGGLILAKMGKIPKRKETMKMGTALLTIEDADAKSIREVMVVLPAEQRSVTIDRR